VSGLKVEPVTHNLQRLSKFVRFRQVYGVGNAFRIPVRRLLEGRLFLFRILVGEDNPFFVIDDKSRFRLGNLL